MEFIRSPLPAQGLDKSRGWRYAQGMKEASAARAYFPRGLVQPPGSFRFSADALLLAAFAARVGARYSAEVAPALLDLGCGCGAAGFGVLLQRPAFYCWGLDLQPDLLAAARQNAARLGFAERYQTVEANLETAASENMPLLPNGQKAHLIIANPPYRLPGQGRLPTSQARRLALFGTAANLQAFLRAAAFNLQPEGRFCLIFPYARRHDLQAALTAQALYPEEGMLISNKAGDTEPFFMLLSLTKQPLAPLGPENMKRLSLYESGGTALSTASLAFCPFLQCNSKRG